MNATPVPIVWLSGDASEIEPLQSHGATFRRLGAESASEAAAMASELGRTFRGLVVVEAACPGFGQVCQLLERAPAIQLVTIHPRLRCMESVFLPPPAVSEFVSNELDDMTTV